MTKKQRCGWCEGDPLYEHYHDTEWGVPLFDDQKLFEFLMLETFQAGLDERSTTRAYQCQNLDPKPRQTIHIQRRGCQI